MAQPRAREPQARGDYAAVSSSRHMFVWGGWAGRNASGLATSTVEIFDVLSAAWQEPQQLRGLSLQDGLNEMAVAWDEEKAYSFGGSMESKTKYINDVYEIALSTLQCTKLVPAAGSAPSPRESSAMICSRRRLVLYGGSRDGLELDDLHVFNLDTNTWKDQATSGEKPPPLSGHTLTMIDQQTALLFGGHDQTGRQNDTYLLDLETWHWSKVRTSGKKPAARSSHAACVIGDISTGHHPLFMLIGGYDDSRTLFSDVWFLDVTNTLWTEVSLPASITARQGHSAAVFGTGPDFRIVVLFGGSNGSYVAMSATTMLLLSQRGETWVVDRVIRPEQLHALDDALKERLSRLQTFTPLSDERAQQVIDKALESSSLPLRNVVSVVTGLMGSGKTWFLARLFNQPPPSLYTSTGVAEQSFRGLLHHIANISLDSWELFSHKKALEFLACRFREELPPADVARLAAKIASLALPGDNDPNTMPTDTIDGATTGEIPVANQKPSTSLTESDTHKSIVRLVKAPKGSQSLTMLELVHMIDTGGQPEYMENMPSLVHNCHLAVLVINLMFGVDDYPPIHYHEKGKAYKRALSSQYSNRDIIQKLASTLQAKRYSRKKGQCFRLLVVATHRDCVPPDQLSARVEAFNKALMRILLPGCEEELITCSANEIAFVLNLKKPDSTDLTKMSLIRDKVSESGVGEVIETPSSFLIFEQELIEFAKMVRRDTLSLDQCQQVGAELKMDSEMVMAALIFFHRQITLLYFQHVLPKVVFTKPQVPLDFINSVVQFSYKVASGDVTGISQKLVSSLRDGIVTEETLKHSILKNCFIPNVYEAHDAISLLCYTFTLAPLSHETQLKTGETGVVQQTTLTPIKRGKREYLMMSLRPAIPEKDIAHYIRATSEIIPLVVKFTNDCVPLSCFSSTISCLLSIYNWRLSRADNGSPECLAHNVVSLYDPQLPVQIVLVDATNHLKIHILPGKGVNKSIYHKVCFSVRETVFSAIPEVFKILQLTGIDISPAFLCSCSQAASKSHSASIHKSVDSSLFLRCSMTERCIGAALEKHMMWLDTPVTEKDKPSLPKLLELDVPEHVGVLYRKFGTFLLNDFTGSLIDAIENDCLGKSHRITVKILQDWLVGKGEAPTWQTLVQTLNRCKLSVLANQIQKECL